ncbi:MAG: hypothetical protein V1749_06645, partial [Candidatus Desantisbacteria bacterium]
MGEIAGIVWNVNGISPRRHREETLSENMRNSGMVQNCSPHGYRGTDNYNPLTPFSKGELGKYIPLLRGVDATADGV